MLGSLPSRVPELGGKRRGHARRHSTLSPVASGGGGGGIWRGLNSMASRHGTIPCSLLALHCVSGDAQPRLLRTECGDALPGSAQRGLGLRGRSLVLLPNAGHSFGCDKRARPSCVRTCGKAPAGGRESQRAGREVPRPADEEARTQNAAAVTQR